MVERVKKGRRRGGGGAILGLLTAAMFLDAAFFALITPLLPEYRERLGLDQLGVGLLFAAHPAGTIVFAAPAAALINRFGARMTMTLGLTALAAGAIGFAFAPSLAPLALCRFVQGGSAALVWCGGLARLRDAVPPERRGAALGLAGSAAAAGALFGPGLAALTVALSVGFVLVALGVVSLVLCAILHGRGETAGERRRSPLEPTGPAPPRGGYGIARPLGVIVVCGTVFGAVAALAPLRLDDLGVGVAAIAALFAVSALGEALASPLAGHISDRVGRLPPIRACLLLAAPLLVIQAAAGSPGVVALAVALTLVAIAALWPLGTALLADESGPGSGSPAGVFASSVVAWSAGLVAGSLLAAALAQSLGKGAAYGALLAACAISLLSLAPTAGLRPDFSQ